MTDVNPTSLERLETWLVDSTGNIAVTGAGIALLDAENLDAPNDSAVEG